MKNPYKELSPYIESDAHRFKGRTSETEEMYESFDRNEYLVCHADSGEGKSSIIEAGLIPKMKANCYFPVRIIFKSDEHFKKNNIDFDKIVCGIIENEIEKLRSNKSISVNVVYPRRLTNSDDFELTNWEKELVDSFAWLKLRYERVTIDNLLYTPVLIFDQFEEVFTNPLSQEWTDKFFTWLQELSTDLCPQRIINELEKHIGNDDFPEINTQKYFKAIFSLRSEYVGKLDYWGIQRHYIPLLKNNRYLLRPLTIKGAKEVITQQDGYDGLNAVADEIIDVLRRQQKGKNYVSNEKSELPCIPALFLSIICSRAFSMSQEERTAFVQRLVAEKDEDKETAINSLIESFYEKAVAECGIPSKDMGIIEDILVNNEGSRQRVSSHADALKAIDFSTKYMEKLKDARLIRVIPEYNREDDSVEFVHDALCSIITKRKELRLAAEAKKREEEKLREQSKMNRKRMMIISSIVLIVCCIIGIVLFIVDQRSRNWELMKKESLYYTAKADNLIYEGNSYMAQMLLLNALPDNLNNPNRPYVSDAEATLRKAHNMNCYILAHSYVMVPEMSPDGKFVLVGNENGTVSAIDVNTGNSKEIIHKQDIYSASFSPNQKLLSTVIGIGGAWISDNPKEYSDILLWNADNGELKMVLKGHAEQVIRTVYSNDGKYIVSSSWDGSVRLWDTSTGKCINKIEKGKSYHESIMGESIETKSNSFNIALSPDSKKLLTNFTTGNIEIWDVQKGICIDSLIGHSNAIWSFQFSPDGKEIVSSESDYTIRLWDVSTGNCKRTLKGHNGNIWDVSYNRDGTKVVTASSDSTVRIWNLHSNTCEKTLKINADAMKASFTPNGQKIVIFSSDRDIWVWEPYIIPTKALANSRVTSTAISSNGEYIALKSVAENVKIWNVKDQRELCLNNDTYVESLFFDNKGTKLVTTSYNSLGHTVNVWNTKTLELLSTFKPENGWSRFKAINISDDNTTIITVSDSTIGLWDANTGNSIKRIPNSLVRNMCNRISISPNGKMCAIATNNDSIYLMNILTMKPVIVLGRQRSVTCLSFSEDNRVLASGSSDGIIKLFHILNDNNPMLLDGGTEVVGLYFSRDMKYLASSHNDYKTNDGKVIIWNIETGNKVSTFNEKGEKILSVHFDIEQGTIEGVSEKGIWYIWPFPSLQQLINETRERFKNRQLTHEEKRKYYIE